MPRNRRIRPERKLIRLLAEEEVAAGGEAHGVDEVVVWVVVEEAVGEVEAGEGVAEGDSRPFSKILRKNVRISQMCRVGDP